MLFNFFKNPNSKKQIFVIFGVLVLLVGLYLLPQSPSKNNESVEKREEFSDAEKKLEEAIRLVETSENPMMGITMLKEIVEEDENNEQALWFLGKFSMRIGKYRKAIERFNKFVDIVDSDDDRASGYIMLSDAYYMEKINDSAKIAISKAEELTENQELKDLIEERKLILFN